jgi:hypothetical protein
MAAPGREAGAAPDVRAHLGSLSAEHRKIVLALRDVVRRMVPDAEETVLWGGLSYHTPWIGGRVKGALCQITAKRGEVRLEFIHGARLADPAGLLRGDRISKRYVVIRSVADVEQLEIEGLIREASALEFPPVG